MTEWIIFSVWFIVAIILAIRLGKHCGSKELFDDLDHMVVYAALWPIAAPAYWAFNRAYKLTKGRPNG